MGLKDSIKRRLEAREDSLMESSCSFIESTQLTLEQIDSFYLLLNNFYRHGLETLDSGSHTGYSRLRILDRLRDEIERYKHSLLTEPDNEISN